MTYFSTTLHNNLTTAFSQQGLTLSTYDDYMLVKGTDVCIEEKICNIFQSFKLCLLLSQINEEYVFTMTPYSLPGTLPPLTFKAFAHIKPTAPPSLELKMPYAEERNHFTGQEIAGLLQHTLFITPKECEASAWSTARNDHWVYFRQYRQMVAASLNKGLSDILSKYVQGNQPIVEIGSGDTYTLLPTLKSQWIRTQPNPCECALLLTSSTEKIYQANIKELCDSLSKAEQKVPLVFALDVFDTLTPTERQQSFLQLSQIQSKGDHLLIMLDIAPCFDRMIKELESLYPDYTLLPFYPLTTDCQPFSLLLVPKSVQEKISLATLIHFTQEHSDATMKGNPTLTQQQLHRLKNALKLQVIKTEEFFANRIQCELDKVGYDVRTYYHTSFTVESFENRTKFAIWQSNAETDVVYKPVSDTVTMRKWRISSPQFFESLKEKEIKMPTVDPSRFPTFRTGNQKIIGAEIFVIEAKKRT